MQSPKWFMAMSMLQSRRFTGWDFPEAEDKITSRRSSRALCDQRSRNSPPPTFVSPREVELKALQPTVFSQNHGFKTER